ncbi:MAG: hypothetical protein R3F17_00620 [Planctomycetota bacterium]
MLRTPNLRPCCPCSPASPRPVALGQEPEPAAPVAEEKPEAVSGAERRELELQAAGLRRELEGLNEELAILRNSNAVEREGAWRGQKPSARSPMPAMRGTGTAG